MRNTPGRTSGARVCLGIGVAFLLAALTAASPAGQSNQGSTPAKAGTARQDAGWLTDDQGRQYKEARISKKEARRVTPELVRTQWGVPIEVVREDEEYFYYKLFRVPDAEPAAAAAPAPAAPPPPVKIAEGRTLALRPFEQGLPTAGQWREGFTVADMNGDGAPDLVVPPARQTLRPPVIFLGDGKGTWRPWREAVYPKIGFDYGATAAGDFNGDGHQDMALAIHLRGIIALLGDGKGGFTAALDGLEFAQGSADMQKAYPSRAILAVDWDRDGRLDLVAQGEGPSLSPAPGVKSAAQRGFGIAVYRNVGDGKWSRIEGGAEPTRLFGTNLAAGDFNADGRIDLVMASSVLGRQDILALGGDDGSWTWGVLTDVPPQSFVRGVAAADFDRDGRDDVALSWLAFANGAWRHGVDTFLSRADGTWVRTALLNQAGREATNSLAAGDVSGDGVPDLAGVTSDGRVMLWRGRGDGSFIRERAADTRAVGGCRGTAVRVADLDGDRQGELVAMFGQEPSTEKTGCTTAGALRAWKVVPAPAVR